MGIDINLAQKDSGFSDAEAGVGPLTQNPKTEARLLAVQAVYRHLLLGDDKAIILQTFDKTYVKSRNANQNLFMLLLDEALEEGGRYQQMIEPLLNEKWRWERVGYVEKAVLLCAFAELDKRQETPFKVVLNEFITIAHSYFDAAEVGFINGILNKAVPLLRG